MDNHSYDVILKNGTVLVPTCRCCLHIIERHGNEWRCTENCRCMMMGCTKPAGID